jgi:hypothetical protein
VSTTVINVVLLQSSIDLGSGERNEVSGGQLEGISDVTSEENQESMTSPLTDPRVGFMLLSVYWRSIGASVEGQDLCE